MCVCCFLEASPLLSSPRERREERGERREERGERRGEEREGRRGEERGGREERGERREERGERRGERRTRDSFIDSAFMPLRRGMRRIEVKTLKKR